MNKMFSFFLVFFVLSKSDNSLTALESSIITDSFTDINELLMRIQAFPGELDIKALEKLGELFLFGDPSRNINRDYSLSVDLFQKALNKGSSYALFIFSTISQEMLLTDEFEVIKSTFRLDSEKVIQEFNLKGFSHATVSRLSAIWQCLKSKHVKLPSFMNEIKDSPLKYPFLNSTDCEITHQIAYAALFQAYYSRNHIDQLGKPEHYFDRIDIEIQNKYGEDIEKAISLSSKLLDSHPNTETLMTIGHEYLHGNNLLGIDPNPQEAKTFLEKAQSLGNNEAAAELGKMHLKGIGVEKNVTKAIEYFEEGVKAGSVEALRQMSVMYEKGEFVARNETRAFEYSRIAAEKGDVQSLNNLGVYYIYGIGVEKNLEKAIYFMTLSAQQGSVMAKYNLGCAYFNGDYVEKNFSIAFDYFMGTVYGAQIDGYMAKAYKRFREGDTKGSYLYYIMAASLGYQSARTSLAYFFDKGLNENKCWLGKEFCLANYLIRAVTESGDKWANEKLAKLLFTGGEFLKANYSEAFLFYQNAPKTGEVLFTLGYLNEHGLGCVQNLTASESYYLEIISLADGKKIDQASKYPAMIALYKLRLKASLKYFFELFQFN